MKQFVNFWLPYILLLPFIYLGTFMLVAWIASPSEAENNRSVEETNRAFESRRSHK